MGQVTTITRKVECNCDRCGKKLDNADLKEWFIIQEVAPVGLRLFQKVDNLRHYESFHIPNKIEKTYCSKDCAMQSIIETMDKFLAEIKFKPETRPRQLL